MDSSDTAVASPLTTVAPLLPLDTQHPSLLRAPSSDVSDDENSREEKDEEEEKKYFCQRCLNHDLHFPRKGHKTECSYANCPCPACAMVEQRRQLNNMISRKKVVHFPSEIKDGRKVRDPKCARCYAHGVFSRLRGHKKNQCLFQHCNCEPCQLVDTRRDLMARQIRLRRSQKKTLKEGGTVRGSGDKKDIIRLPPLTPNSPLVVPTIRPIAVAPQSIGSLSPSIGSISPSLSTSSFSSIDSSSPPVPQLFPVLPHIPSSFISLPLPLHHLPPPPLSQSLSPALIQFLILTSFQNQLVPLPFSPQ